MRDARVEQSLLSNLTIHWRKASLVVGMSMLSFERDERAGKDDAYFFDVLIGLSRIGSVEISGDTNSIRDCEVRKPEIVEGSAGN